jgi:predicted phage tail protein
MPTKLIATMLILLCGCSTTATISRANGRELEGKIVGSNPSSILVETDGDSTLRIPRAEITDIDHPGNAAAVVGGFLGAYGALNIATGVSACDEGGAAFCAGVFLPATLGVSMLIWGLTTWSNSTGAAAKPPSSTQVPSAPSAAAFDFSGAPNQAALR